jgi:hypothetical protein
MDMLQKGLTFHFCRHKNLIYSRDDLPSLEIRKQIPYKIRFETETMSVIYIVLKLKEGQ